MTALTGYRSVVFRLAVFLYLSTDLLEARFLNRYFLKRAVPATAQIYPDAVSR